MTETGNPTKNGQRPILIDVSHTFASPHNTGVQRVVRHLALYARLWPQCSLIRFDATLQEFVVLTSVEVEFLLTGWHTPMKLEPTGSPRVGILGVVVGVMKALGVFRPIAKLKDILVVHAVRPLKRELRLLMGRSRGVNPEGCLYLTAEVFGEGDRVRYLRRWFQRSDVKVFLVVHDLIPYSHPQWSIMKRADFQRYLSLLPYADLISADSDHTQAEVIRWFGDLSHRCPPTIVRTYPGFDPTRVSPEVPAGLEGVQQFLAAIGTVEPRKNQLRLLSSLKTLWDSGRSFTFVFAGNEAPGYTAFRTEWQRLVAAGYPVHWLCPASEREVQWLYKNAMATVYPSLCEGYGLPIVESLFHGTPCISSSTTSTGEVARLVGGCLLVDPENTDSITAAVARILDEPNLGAELVAGVKKEHIRSWEDFANDLHRLAQGTQPQ